MRNFVMAIGALAFLGFLLWAILPAYTSILNVVNSTAVNATALELAEWNLIPLVIPAIIIVALIWYYFRERGREE